MNLQSIDSYLGELYCHLNATKLRKLEYYMMNSEPSKHPFVIVWHLDQLPELKELIGTDSGRICSSKKMSRTLDRICFDWVKDGQFYDVVIITIQPQIHILFDRAQLINKCVVDYLQYPTPFSELATLTIPKSKSSWLPLEKFMDVQRVVIVRNHTRNEIAIIRHRYRQRRQFRVQLAAGEIDVEMEQIVYVLKIGDQIRPFQVGSGKVAKKMKKIGKNIKNLSRKIFRKKPAIEDAEQQTDSDDARSRSMDHSAHGDVEVRPTEDAGQQTDSDDARSRSLMDLSAHGDVEDVNTRRIEGEVEAETDSSLSPADDRSERSHQAREMQYDPSPNSLDNIFGQSENEEMTSETQEPLTNENDLSRRLIEPNREILFDGNRGRRVSEHSVRSDRSNQSNPSPSPFNDERGRRVDEPSPNRVVRQEEEERKAEEERSPERFPSFILAQGAEEDRKAKEERFPSFILAQGAEEDRNAKEERAPERFPSFVPPRGAEEEWKAEEERAPVPSFVPPRGAEEGRKAEEERSRERFPIFVPARGADDKEVQTEVAWEAEKRTVERIVEAAKRNQEIAENGKRAAEARADTTRAAFAEAENKRKAAEERADAARAALVNAQNEKQAADNRAEAVKAALGVAEHRANAAEEQADAARTALTDAQTEAERQAEAARVAAEAEKRAAEGRASAAANQADVARTTLTNAENGKLAAEEAAEAARAALGVAEDRANAAEKQADVARVALVVAEDGKRTADDRADAADERADAARVAQAKAEDGKRAAEEAAEAAKEKQEIAENGKRTAEERADAATAAGPPSSGPNLRRPGLLDLVWVRLPSSATRRPGSHDLDWVKLLSMEERCPGRPDLDWINAPNLERRPGSLDLAWITVLVWKIKRIAHTEQTCLLHFEDGSSTDCFSLANVVIHGHDIVMQQTNEGNMFGEEVVEIQVN